MVCGCVMIGLMGGCLSSKGVLMKKVFQVFVLSVRDVPSLGEINWTNATLLAIVPLL